MFYKTPFFQSKKLSVWVHGAFYHRDYRTTVKQGQIFLNSHLAAKPTRSRFFF